VNLVFCGLIVLGGLGFLVMRDLKEWLHWRLVVRKGKRPRLTTHTRVVLSVTGALLLIGFVGVFVTESFVSMQDAPLKERMLGAMFQSITPRTAGFNTLRLGSQGARVAGVAPATALLLIALMFIGGSPGSTAGGIKTTTLGVMAASIIATLRGRGRAELFHHSVRQETVHRVASVILLGITVLLAGTFCLLATEQGASFKEVLFECTSAFGTVGLSLGLTPELTIWGRLVLPVLMFIGRLGPITIVMSAAVAEGPTPYRYPTAEIIVG
jgi:trk system potassium uptake protein TrkH